MLNVIIIGAGGHAKVVADIVQKSGDRVVGFLDNRHSDGEFINLPILGKDTDYEQFMQYQFVIAIGNAIARERIATTMKSVQWYTAIHPNAVISTINTSIGEGTVVMANAVINPSAQIGKHCIINTSSLVEHDNTISDYVHIAVGAKLAGTVTVGKRTWVGAGTTVSNNVTICSDCIIGAGSVIVKDIVETGTYVGIPAKRIK